MYDIFLSYTRQDKPRASSLAAVLEQAGWSVWWDVELMGGDLFTDIIQERIAKAGCSIVLWSERSVGSPWVRAEAEAAMKRGVLIPVRLDEAEPPFPFGQLHEVDLRDWDGDVSHPELISLTQAVSCKLKGAPEAPAEAGRRAVFQEAVLDPASPFRSAAGRDSGPADRLSADLDELFRENLGRGGARMDRPANA